MSNYISLAVFVIIAFLIYLFDRKKFKKEAPLFYLRRTERGLDFINRFSSRHKRFFGVFSDLGIIFSFGAVGAWYIAKAKKSKKVLLKTLLCFSVIYAIFGLLLKSLYPEVISIFGASGFILVFLLKSAYEIVFVPAAVSAVQLVLPVSIPGAPIFFVPIDFWLISIFVILIAHEFSHAFVARAQGIKIKSLGYGFLAILPLGFAEPDEKQIRKSSSLVKTKIFGAGSFANFIVALICIPLMFGIIFVYSHSVEMTGVSYNETIEDMPAYGVLPEYGVITRIGENETKDLYTLFLAINSFKPGDILPVVVNNNTYEIILAENPENSTKAYIGISNLEQKSENKIAGVMGGIIPGILKYLATLLNFIFGLNLGIGLVNILPLKPLDGGLMFEEIMKTTKIKGWARISKTVSVAVLVLLLFNLFGPSFV